MPKETNAFGVSWFWATVVKLTASLGWFLSDVKKKRSPFTWKLPTGEGCLQVNWKKLSRGLSLEKWKLYGGFILICYSYFGEMFHLLCFKCVGSTTSEGRDPTIPMNSWTNSQRILGLAKPIKQEQTNHRYHCPRRIVEPFSIWAHKNIVNPLKVKSS